MPLYRSVRALYSSGDRLYWEATYVSLRACERALRRALWHVVHLGPGWGSFLEELPQSLHARTVFEGLDEVVSLFRGEAGLFLDTTQIISLQNSKLKEIGNPTQNF